MNITRIFLFLFWLSRQHFPAEHFPSQVLELLSQYKQKIFFQNVYPLNSLNTMFSYTKKLAENQAEKTILIVRL